MATDLHHLREAIIAVARDAATRILAVYDSDSSIGSKKNP